MEKAEQLEKVKENSRREKVLKRIMEANHLFQEEQRQIQATCDAKKQINAEIQHAIGTKRQFEWQRQDQQLKARQIQRENRDKEQAIKYFKQQEDEVTKKVCLLYLPLLIQLEQNFVVFFNRGTRLKFVTYIF